MLGLLCCRLSLASEFGRCSPVAMHGLLLAVASLVWEPGSRHAGFSSCGAQVQLLLGIWNVPRPGIEPVSPALVGSYLHHLGSQAADKCSFSLLS